jgi:hypothetical protein
MVLAACYGSITSPEPGNQIARTLVFKFALECCGLFLYAVDEDDSFQLFGRAESCKGHNSPRSA